MTLYHTLETLSFGSAYNGHLVAFGKDVNTNGVADIFISFAIAYFFYYFFCRSICFGKMIFFREKSMLFFFIPKSYLKCIVTISCNGFLLSDHAWPCFNNSDSSLLTTIIENAGHANFFSNNTFHFYFIIPSAPQLRR